MSVRAKFRSVISICWFSLGVTGMALSQGVPIAFELDDSGIISREFTNPRQPFPLECLLTGKCGEGDFNSKFPRTSSLVGKDKNGKVVSVSEFYFRFENLSPTKTYLLSIPMDIKVEELLKYVIRVGYIQVDESEASDFLAGKKKVDEKLEKLPELLKKDPADRKENLIEILEEAVTPDQVKRALALVTDSQKSKILELEPNITLEKASETVNSYFKWFGFLEFLKNQNPDSQSLLWKNYKNAATQRGKGETPGFEVLKILIELERLQQDLLKAYKGDLKEAFALAEAEFRIRQDFSKTQDKSHPERSRFLNEFFEVCPSLRADKNDTEGKDSEKRSPLGSYFSGRIKERLKSYGFVLNQEDKIDFSSLSMLDKSRLLSFFGSEIFSLSPEEDTAFLQFLTHFYLGKEKSPLGGTTGAEDTEHILESILRTACSNKKELISGKFFFLMDPGDQIPVQKSQLLILDRISAPREEMFTIEVSVFNEADVITQPKGYVVWKGGRDLKSDEDWKLSGTMAYRQTPYLEDTPKFKPLRVAFLDKEGREMADGVQTGDRVVVGELKPYISDQSEFLSGTGKLTLDGNLTTLAKAQVVLQYQSRNFGGEDTSDKVTAPLYRLAVHQRNGNTFAFGKFEFDKPASNLGISLMGDGVQWQHRRFDVGYLIRKESEAGKANAANRDHKIIWGRVPNLGLPRWGIFHRLSFHALYGQNEKDIYKIKAAEIDNIKGIPVFSGSPDDEDPDLLGYYEVEEDTQPYNYWTLGLQQRFSLKHSDTWSSSGSLSYFQSERRARSNDTSASLTFPGGIVDDNGEIEPNDVPRAPFERGEGRSWLLSWSLQENRIKKKQVPENDVKNQFTFLVGHGSGGYREENHLNRGYLGETSSFAPDMIFLSGLASALARVEPTIGSGLSNKTYASMSFQRSGAPLVKTFMKVFGWDEKLTKASTTFSLHYYRLNTIDMPRANLILQGELLAGSTDMRTPVVPYALDSKSLGWEFNLLAQASLPNNLKTQLMGAYFAPGSALDDLVQKDLWFAGLSFGMGF